MNELIDFLKDNFEKNSYTITFCDFLIDDMWEAVSIEFHKNSKHYSIYYFEYQGRITDVIKWGEIYPELEAEFLLVKETLSSNGYELESYGAIKNKEREMILRIRKDPYYFDFRLSSAKAK